MKVGFCLIDSQRVETHGPARASTRRPRNNFCGQDEPQRPSLVEGVSAGWRDLYDRTLAFQWVDVTDVQPGRLLAALGDRPRRLRAREQRGRTPRAFATASSTIPGYRAKPVDAGVVSATGPTTIHLATDSFGSGLGARAFRIIAPPRHGTLNQAERPDVLGVERGLHAAPRLGRARTGSPIRARDSASTFPRYPAAAAVTLNVGGVSPNVALSGAPASMSAGTSARLFATRDRRRPARDVDGRRHLRRLAAGRQRRPDRPRTSRRRRRRRRAGHDPGDDRHRRFDEVTIAITDPPPPQPAPSPRPRRDWPASRPRTAPSVAEAGAGPQGWRPCGGVPGRRRTRPGTPASSGCARATATGCSAAAACALRAGRTLTCRVPLPRACRAR